MKGKLLAKIVIQSKVFSVYVWDDIVEMNAYEVETARKYMAFPDRYKFDPEEPYGSDGFIAPASREIHVVKGDLYSDEIVLRNLAHEIAHAIFHVKDKDDYYRDERLVDACAETYEEIGKCITDLRKALESRK